MLFRFAIRFPWLVLLLATLVTLGIAPGALRLQIRTDGHALVPPHSPEIHLDEAIRDQFGIEDPFVVLIRSDHPMGIFNAKTLELVQEFTNEFQGFDTVTPGNVTSLAVERGDRVRPGTLYFRRFFDPMPQTGEELSRLRSDLRAIELYNGVLVSNDEKSTAILIGVPKGVSRTAFYQQIVEHVAAKGDRPEQIDVLGAPVAEALLGTHLLEDLGVPGAVLGHELVNETKIEWKIPSNLYELQTLIGQRIGLVPVALAVMVFVFLLSFRNLLAPLLPMSEVGACLAVIFGLMGWLDVPVYLTIAVLPVILTAIGVADEIHIFARYRELLREDPHRHQKDVLLETMSEMWRPISKTSFTTAFGFLSFALSPIQPVQMFGIFTAAGVLFCMLWSLTVIPALLVLIPATWLVRRPKERSERQVTGAIFSGLGRLTLRLRWPIVIAIMLLFAAAPWGASRIVVQDSWIDGFAPRSAFHKATTYFNEQYLGVHTLLIRVNAGDGEVHSGKLTRQDLAFRGLKIPSVGIDDPESLVGQAIYLRRDGLPGGVKVQKARSRPIYTWSSRIVEVIPEGDQLMLVTDRRNGSPELAMKLRFKEEGRYRIRPEWFMRPDYAELVGDLSSFIEGHTDEAVGGVLGTADYLATTEFMIRARKEGSRAIPETWDRMQWVWGQYRKVRGEHRWRQAVTEDYSSALVSVFLKNANFVDTKRLMENIRAYEIQHLIPKGVTLDFAGDVAVSQTLIDAIVTTQVDSLIGSLIGIFLITSILGRSLVWGLLCVLPCALVVLVNFAVMGITNMPLGVATSMFSGMTLGIGVDFAIHLMERYRLGVSKGLSPDDAIVDAVRATSPAISIDALAVALGFGVLLLSQVPPNARLGVLVVLSIAGCLLATLFVLPALLRVFGLRPVIATHQAEA